MHQYTLPLHPGFASYAPEDFITTENNLTAFDWITCWPDWPSPCFYLYGPEGSGKTHLTHIWCALAKGQLLQASELGTIPPANAHNVLEEIEFLEDEAALFHLINWTQQSGGSLLLTSQMPASMLPFQLPDLCSRLRALPSATLSLPDDNALAIIFTKLFADRQLQVSSHVIHYLITRCERSFTAVHAMVDAIDRYTLQEKTEITVQRLKKIL